MCPQGPNTPPIGRPIRRLKRGHCHRCAIAHSAEIAHIDPIHHVALKDVGSHPSQYGYLDPNDTPVGPGQIQAEMPIDRPKPPRHFHARARPISDQSAEISPPAIRGQRRCWPLLDQARAWFATALLPPKRRSAQSQIAEIALDPHGHPQIQPGTIGVSPFIAHARQLGFRFHTSRQLPKSPSEGTIAGHSRVVPSSRWGGAVALDSNPKPFGKGLGA